MEPERKPCSMCCGNTIDGGNGCFADCDVDMPTDNGPRFGVCCACAGTAVEGKSYFDELYPLRFWRQNLYYNRLSFELASQFVEAVADELSNPVRHSSIIKTVREAFVDGKPLTSAQMEDFMRFAARHFNLFMRVTSENPYPDRAGQTAAEVFGHSRLLSLAAETKAETGETIPTPVPLGTLERLGGFQKQMIRLFAGTETDTENIQSRCRALSEKFRARIAWIDAEVLKDPHPKDLRLALIVAQAWHEAGCPKGVTAERIATEELPRIWQNIPRTTRY